MEQFLDIQPEFILNQYPEPQQRISATPEAVAGLGYVPESRTVNGQPLTANVTISAADIPTDSTHRFVTDTDKSNWNAKSQYGTKDNGLNPGATNSTVGVMAGLNQVITAKMSRVLVIISGQAENNTGNDGFKFDIRYGTGSAPTNGAALAGTVSGGQISGKTAVSGAENVIPIIPFCHHTVISGLTPGTAYWFDLGQYAVTGGTVTFSNVNITIIEL